MKMKVYVIDLEIPARVKAWGIRVGILVVLLGTAAIAIAADSIHAWKAGDPLTAAELNANFANVQPPGMIGAFGGTGAPAGWLACDGTSMFRSDYPALFAAIGTTWGAADATHFNVPDLRGQFLRGANGTSSHDPGPRTACAAGSAATAVGSCEPDAFQGWKPQIHTAVGNGVAIDTSLGTDYVMYSQGGIAGRTMGNIYRDDVYAFLPFATYGTPRVSSETRPQNVAVSYFIKY
jgi:hypothetical protein